MTKKVVLTNEQADVDQDHAMSVEDFLPRQNNNAMRKERPLTLRLDELTLSKLRVEAERKGVGVSTLVRIWVRERLESVPASH